MLTTAAAGAADVAVVGLFPGKAVLVIDGRGPHTVAEGSTRDGVRVVSVDATGATLEVQGRRTRVPLGNATLQPAVDQGKDRVVLTPDARGHYVAQGSVNGSPVRFLVDTGATAVTLSTEFARRAGIDTRDARPVIVLTANGRVPGRQVRLDRVALGGLVLHQVDAIIQDGLGDQALLGMTFLSRTELRNEGNRLVVSRR